MKDESKSLTIQALVKRRIRKSGDFPGPEGIGHVLSIPLWRLHRLIKTEQHRFSRLLFQRTQLGPPRVNEKPLQSFVPRNHLLYAVFPCSALVRVAEPDLRYWSLLSHDGKRSTEMRNRLDANWSTGWHTVGILDAMRFHNSGIGLRKRLLRRDIGYQCCLEQLRIDIQQSPLRVA